MMSWDDIDEETEDTGNEAEMDELLEEMQDEPSYNDLDESLQAILDNQQVVMESAKIRLAQGRLYEMLLKHDIFDSEIDEDPRAVKKVQSEVRAFVTERLEIMLGMRSAEPKQATIQSVTVELPFNEVEVQALKAIASKLSKGESDSGVENIRVEAEVKTEMGALPPKRAPQQKAALVKPTPRPPVRAALPSAPKKPLDRKQPKEKPVSGKELHKMTEAELAAYAQRMKVKKVGTPSGVQPIPMPDQMMMDNLAANAAERNSSGSMGSQNPKDALNSWIASNLRGAHSGVVTIK
jgi:hypothetical protein